MVLCRGPAEHRLHRALFGVTGFRRARRDMEKSKKALDKCCAACYNKQGFEGEACQL